MGKLQHKEIQSFHKDAPFGTLRQSYVERTWRRRLGDPTPHGEPLVLAHQLLRDKNEEAKHVGQGGDFG